MRRHAIRARPEAVLVVWLPDQLPNLVYAGYNAGQYWIRTRNGPTLSIDHFGNVRLLRTGQSIHDAMDRYGWT